MQNIQAMSTADILYRMEEIREYEPTEALTAEFAALYDERQKRYLADAAIAAQRMMRGEI
jgi:hypothetical protein